MPIDLDGLAVLSALVRDPELFPGARGNVNELAHKLVSARLAKKPPLEILHRIRKLMTESDFRLILDEMSDKACKALLKSVDPHSPLLKEQGADLRGRLSLLSGGEAAAPAPKKGPKTTARVAPGSRPKGVRKRKTPVRTLSSRAMNAAWDGKNRDDDKT